MDMVRARHLMLASVRNFFYGRGYLEVETPYLMKTASPDPYIEPLRVFIGEKGPYFLHTSPEMGMKKMLAQGYERIFQICKVFRIEEFEEHHSTEFTMLEWYCPGSYLDAMQETEDLVRFIAGTVGENTGEWGDRSWDVYALRQLFIELTGMDPLPLPKERLVAEMERRGFQGLQKDDSWEDCFFKLFLQEVEPRIGDRRKAPFFITDWPASLTAMAKKKDDHTVERFELYMRGLEIANGYTELLDPSEQRERLERDNEARKDQGKPVYPVDDAFLRALSRISGSVTGVSIGLDRLLMVLFQKDSIGDVLFDRFSI
ncbi:MAG: Elongation factor P--(R)-beta-lysine ligase [Syntrophorhabdaceae bacterium PtaU1.Bin034]|nr:MAG: Elongation factor P--(R)-beta-lysine ligase [Syntrophorhabdaceae bacterium PtaU1.Bin034]